MKTQNLKTLVVFVVSHNHELQQAPENKKRKSGLFFPSQRKGALCIKDS